MASVDYNNNLVKTEPSEDNQPIRDDAIWAYRGYKMRNSEFNTAMVHYYRAEIQRSNTWRIRLDTTTYWAVVTSGAAITFSLSSPSNHYGVILINTILITLFLWIEARRYRYYELWSFRARLMETDFFAAMLVPPFAPRTDWAEALSGSLLQPKFTISIWEAIGRRLRRNYVWIFIILMAAWLFKGYLHPVPATTWAEFVSRATLGPISGAVILTIGAIYLGVIIAVALITIGIRRSSGEVFA